MRELSPEAEGIARENFDSWMTEVDANPEPWRVLLGKRYPTIGGLEWGPAPWRVRSECSLEATTPEGGLELDVDRIPDEVLKIESPIHIVPSAINWTNGADPERMLTGEAAWAAVPRRQAVRGLELVANHSKLAARARALGVTLRISPAVLQGHGAVLEGLRLRDVGAIGAESFPLVITGALSGYDRHALSTVDPSSHVFDEDGERSRIEHIEIDGYVSSESNNQVSHAMIVGGFTNDRIQRSPWAELGKWGHIYRKNPRIANVHGVVRDRPATENQCQLATLYQNIGGEITECSTRGYQAGAYGDVYRNFSLHIHRNDFEALRPVAQLLSPTAPGAEDCVHEDVKIQRNWLRCVPTDVEGWHGGVLLLRFDAAPGRRIRNVLVDDNDIVMAAGAKAGRGNVAVNAQGVDMLNITPSNRIVGFPNPWRISESTGVTLPPGMTAERKGCNPFR